MTDETFEKQQIALKHAFMSLSIPDTSTDIIAEGMRPKSPNDAGNINYSTILTKLIQDTGRFVESFASDLFIDWNTVIEDIIGDDPIDKIYAFALRESGVDHMPFLCSHVSQSKETYRFPEEYRRVYLLWITNMPDENGQVVPRFITMHLRDATKLSDRYVITQIKEATKR